MGGPPRVYKLSMERLTLGSLWMPMQPERVSTAAYKGWVLECGLWRADPGRGLRWAMRRHPEGTWKDEDRKQLVFLPGSLLWW